MTQDRRVAHNRAGRGAQRSAATIAVVAVSMTALLGFVALAIDMGMVYSAKAELQRSADATALAASWKLLGPERLRGESYRDEVFAEARQEAADLAAKNPLLGDATIVDPDEDILIGFLADPTDPDEAISLVNMDAANAAQVTVRRDDERGGSISLFFGSLFGSSSKDLSTEAVAAFSDDIIGFRIEDDSDSHPKLLPFALRDTFWEQLIAKSRHDGDNFTYNDTGEVSAGGDGIYELNLYPGAGHDQLPPGNMGTVDLCNPNNSANDLARQILTGGLNEADLSYCDTPGELRLGDDRTVSINGDDGLSAGMKEELTSIIGEERIIPLFDDVDGNGNNCQYNVVKWVGIRIMRVKLSGPMKKKEVLIQAATVVDSTAFSDPGANSSSYVFTPPRLVR